MRAGGPRPRPDLEENPQLPQNQAEDYVRKQPASGVALKVLNEAAPVARRAEPVLERQPSVSGPLKLRIFAPSRRRRLMLLQFVLIAPAVAYVVAMFAYPLVYGVTMSLENFTFAALVHGSGPFSGLANYRTVIHDPVTGTAVINTLIYTTASIFLQFTIGLGLAVFFNRQFPLSRMLRSMLLVPWLIPLVASGTIFSLLFSGSGYVNHVLLTLHIIHQPIYWLDSRVSAMAVIILVSVWAGIPFFALLLYSGLQDVPVDLIEAAALDGAGPPKRFRYVTLPLLRPVIAIVLMLGLIYTVKTFDIVIVLTSGGPGNATQLLSTDAYTQAFTDFSFGPGAAIGNLLLVFCTIVAIIYIRSVRPETSGR
jgi:multiple sugar transport system permease protein